MAKLVDVPENTDIVKIRKQISKLFSEARNAAKPDKCILCGKPQTSFCNSHSIPQLSLRNISSDGKLLLASALMGIEVVDDEKGVNNSGTFHFICNDCDGSFFQDYENEQKALTQEVIDSQQALENANQKVTDLRLLLRTLREMTEINELTPTLVNSLIERIEVHNNDKSSGHCYVKVDIYFTAVGMIDIPTEQEILAMMEEIRANPQEFRFVA